MEVLTAATTINQFNKSMIDQSTRSSYVHTYLLLSQLELVISSLFQ